jgi:hypothetical protein
MRTAIVELHDVTPYYYDEVAQALDLLSVCGIQKYSLLVVPNFWNKTPLYKHSSFVKAILATNQEIVLHGFNHRGGTLKDTLWTFREGEFSGLTLSETYERLKQAVEVLLEAIGVKPYAFVPPAWIGNPHLEDVLYSMDFKAVAYRGHIKDLETDTLHPSPVITFSNRPLLSSLSIALGPALFRLFKNHRILRLAFHARDFRDKRKVKLWRFLLGKVKRTRRLINYEELISESRLAPSL